MTAILKVRRALRDRRGSAAVEFIFTTAMLILIFMVLVSALVYVTQFYSASYIARRVVRTIEIAGEYDEREIRSLANELGGTALEDLRITVDATYCKAKKIQLKETFTVHLSAVHRLQILLFGSNPVSIDLPIDINLSGRSEVYWK